MTVHAALASGNRLWRAVLLLCLGQALASVRGDETRLGLGEDGEWRLGAAVAQVSAGLVQATGMRGGAALGVQGSSTGLVFAGKAAAALAGPGTLACWVRIERNAPPSPTLKGFACKFFSASGGPGTGKTLEIGWHAQHSYGLFACATGREPVAGEKAPATRVVAYAPEPALDDGHWHQVVLTWDPGNRLCLYGDASSLWSSPLAADQWPGGLLDRVVVGCVPDATVRVTLEGFVLDSKVWRPAEILRRFRARTSTAAVVTARYRLTDQTVWVSITAPEAVPALPRRVRIRILDPQGQTAVEQTVDWPAETAVTEAVLQAQGMPVGPRTVSCVLLAEQDRELTRGEARVYILGEPPT
jgi:hypothetical protein